MIFAQGDARYVGWSGLSANGSLLPSLTDIVAKVFLG
jgi:hypothetical protein